MPCLPFAGTMKKRRGAGADKSEEEEEQEEDTDGCELVRLKKINAQHTKTVFRSLRNTAL